MSYIKLENVTINGVNMYDKKRKIWNIFSQNKSKPIRILKNMNFEAKDGDRIGLLGKNGQGKSSLVKVITGIYPPHSGSCVVNGKVLPVIEGGAGVIMQSPARFAVKMVFVYNYNYHQYSEKVLDEIFEFADLNDYKDVPLTQYSSGMVARLVLSAVLFQNIRDIVIFDEVSYMMDVKFQERALDKIKEIWNSADICIMVSHNMEDIKKLCDKCVVIHDGGVIASGKTEDMIEVYSKLL